MQINIGLEIIKIRHIDFDRLGDLWQIRILPIGFANLIVIYDFSLGSDTIHESWRYITIVSHKG